MYKQSFYNNNYREYYFPQMQQANINFIQMANQIHNIQVYNQMFQYMNSFDTLTLLFNTEVDKSTTLLFVACQMLSKKLINHQLISVSDDFDTSLKSAQSLQVKKFTIFKISCKLYQIITGPNRGTLPQYIIRSCINTISLCINAIISSSSTFQNTYINYFKVLVPDFALNQLFIKSSNQSGLYFVQPSRQALGYHHQYAIQIFSSLLDYIVNSTYFTNYYYFRRNLYAFRNNYLSYLLQYSLFALKTVFKHNINPNSSLQTIYLSVRPALKLLQNIVMYPFSLHMHESQIQDEIHENISGLQSEIYFPTYFRNFLCDTGLLMDIISYYSKLNSQSMNFQPIREDIYSLIRIIGRILSTTEYVFVGQDEKKAFRSISVNFVTRILKQNKFYDSYLIMCISKINIKFMSIQNQDQIFQGKKQYFQALTNFLCQGIAQCEGKIQDGDKHPYRQIFQVLIAYVNISANTILDNQSKLCAQQVLQILIKQRLINNENNNKMMKQFGYNNSQQIDCFMQIFARVPQIFKINLAVNLTTLHQLNISVLNNQSLTFWLHLTSLLLPQHDTSIEQTQLILKFLQAAIQARSIASLHYIQILIQQILYQIKDGISSTYLWKFIQQSKSIRFQQFLSYIIKYAMDILTVPNYTLIENCLQLFKAMFTKLCKYRHKSFSRYFQIIEQVCKQIDNTMLVKPQYIKLRIGFFSVISIIWINQGQVNFVYRIFNNIMQTLGQHADYIHFIRYMTDITGLLEPVESAQIFKILIELVLVDMRTVLPFYLGTQQKIRLAYSQEIFLKTFVKFILTIINDNQFRLTYDVHTELPLKIQQIFRPYLIEVLKYDYPKKTIQTWLKFIKLNPLGKLLPLNKSLKQKNSPHYKNLLRQYFQNLHRLTTLQQFYYMYEFIDDNIDLMIDWWDQIMIRGLLPNINVGLVVNARIWSNSRQKEQLGRLLYRIGKYDERYWKIEIDVNSQARYSDWFLMNYN